MCKECWLSIRNNEPDRELTLTEKMYDTAENIKALYNQWDAETGGPLHAILDDWNISESHLIIEDGDEFNWLTISLAEDILRNFREMDKFERGLTLAFAQGMETL